MTIGKPSKFLSGRSIRESLAQHLGGDRRRNRRGVSTSARARRANIQRQLHAQPLEARQLLAGPELIGIQANSEVLIQDSTSIEGAPSFGTSILQTAPNELRFQFDDNSSIDAETLVTAATTQNTDVQPLGITITRAGADGLFETASAITDFNSGVSLGTDSRVVVEFRTTDVLPGVEGNGTQVIITASSKSLTVAPVVISSVDPDLKVVRIDLNTNPNRPASARDLILALQNSSANTLIEAYQVSGSSVAAIGSDLPTTGTTLTLDGANAARVITDLGLGQSTELRIIADQSGDAGTELRVALASQNFGGAIEPQVSINGSTILVRLNSTPGFESTIDDLINALNGTPSVSGLVTASLLRGDLATVIGGQLTNTPGSSALVLEFEGGSDTVVTPGYIGIGDSPNEVVFRFAEPLPEDSYQIEIYGSGDRALLNEDGEAFNDGVDQAYSFSINTAPQVLAVVPEPVSTVDGRLISEPNVVEVYFSNDVSSSAFNPDYYSAVYTNDTITSDDDVSVQPTSVVALDGRTDAVRLIFASSFARPDAAVVPNYESGTSVRLRIGNDTLLPEQLASLAVTEAGDSLFAEGTLPGPVSVSTFDGSDVTRTTAIRLTGGEISNATAFELQFPGGTGYEGVRDIRPDDPTSDLRTVPLGIVTGDADSTPGISTIYYNFPDSFQGDDLNTSTVDIDRTYSSTIGLGSGQTESDRQAASIARERVREVASLFGEYLGVQFIEVGQDAATAISSTSFAGTPGPVYSIAVGELEGAGGSVSSGEGGITVATRALDDDGNTFVGFPTNADNGNQLIILDAQDFQESTDDYTGGEFFRGVFLGIGQLLGYGYADHLPQPITQSADGVLDPDVPVQDQTPATTDDLADPNESLFPSPADIVNGQYLYRPESNDIDLYEFTLQNSGTISLSTIAERLSTSSTLDTMLRLYIVEDGVPREIAANDDYFSNDSLIEIDVVPGKYVVGVSASGNDSYDPSISGTGLGGVTEGNYELAMSFTPSSASGIVDVDNNALDGDADGEAGGLFQYWFEPTNPNTTVYVDNTSAPASGATGTINSPYSTIAAAFSAVQNRLDSANPVQTIRVAGEGTYRIGFDQNGAPLTSGELTTIEVPKDVNLVLDGGVRFEMSGSRIGVGSTTSGVDRSGASIQILGTPDNPVELVGTGTSVAGTWGGIDIRGDVDYADESRTNLEDAGVFLNHIQYADIQGGGGRVSVDGVIRAVAPIELAETRATIINSSITRSADGAIAATPDTFLETRFDEARFQTSSVLSDYFTSDYVRVGPQIRGNTITDNTYNGLLIRIDTPTGDGLQELTINARFDDTDIVHILTDNLLIEGNPGGPLAITDGPSLALTTQTATINQTGVQVGDVPAGTYAYQLTNVTSDGFESVASDPSDPVTLSASGSIRLSNIPTVSAASGFSGRRLYRAEVLGTDPISGELIYGDFLRVGQLNTSNTSFTDTSAAGTLLLNPALTGDSGLALIGRLDPGLTIDPGTIVKLDGARIDVTFGARLYAEGTSDEPIVLTSLNDSRYGTGGTFNTNGTLQGSTNSDNFEAGDWSGIYLGFGADGSFDHAVIAGGGGTSQIEGGFASFNVIESHQSDLRIANTRFEDNLDGRGFLNDEGNDINAPNDPREERVGRVNNASGTVFIRGSQPTIINNTFIDGEGPALTFDLNSFTWQEVTDSGRSTGELDALTVVSNSGPLVQGNEIDGGLAGMEVRGGTVSTEIVWDDTDIVHIVRDMIEVPNQHIYGGLRLESDARGSLVVKFENQDNSDDALLQRRAGIVVGGNTYTAEDEFIGIADRIGGSLQVIGQPDFPVILTALADDSVGAGFTPTGEANLDTDGTDDSPNSGSWDGIVIREAASDSNVSITKENEPANVGNSDTNALASRSQYLGEVAPSVSAGDENSRLGLIVEGDISSASDVDVYSFVAEAGTLVWLDIDRTDASLDTVIELVNSNGQTLVLSDDAMAEAEIIETLRALDTSDPSNAAQRAQLQALLDARTGRGSLALDSGSLFGLATGQLDAGTGIVSYQDNYSTNSRDAGMQVVLPGTAGVQSLYYVRVRSAISTATKDTLTSDNKNAMVVGNTSFVSETITTTSALNGGLRQGLTNGSYQLQIRIEETDAHAGTQIRYSDVFYADNGIEVIGGPLHSPLSGESYENDADNDGDATTDNGTLAGAQRLGLYDTQYVNGIGLTNNATQNADGSILIQRDGVDIVLDNPAGPLSSDLLATNISGFIDGTDDVDWYQFDIDYQELTRDGAEMYLATVFDLDYSDGLGRADLALHVFDADGRLVLIGGDSNIADDIILPGTTGGSDLTRGSYGTADPYIGSAELPEGTYYVAVSNQGQVPAVLDQFNTRDATNPLIRLEPIDSTIRVAEEGFDFLGATGYSQVAEGPTTPILFDQNSVVDYSLDDVFLYVNSGSSLFMVNPFTGEQYAAMGSFDNQEVRDIAFAANGELFAYTTYLDGATGDTTWNYVRLSTVDGSIEEFLSAGAGISTFNDLNVEEPPAVQILDEASNAGLTVEALTIRARNGIETGFFVGNRPGGASSAGLEYTTNILYAFNEETGLATGPEFDLTLFNSGAGTDIREVGQIDTTPTDFFGASTAFSTALGLSDATDLNVFGESVAQIFDGDTFTLFDGTDSVTFEFNQGYTLIATDPAQIQDGTTIRVQIPGGVPTIFEVTNGAVTTPGNIAVSIDRLGSSTNFVETLAEVLQENGFQVSYEGTQLTIPAATDVQLIAPPLGTLAGLSLTGDELTQGANVGIAILPTDSASVIAQRIVQAVNREIAGGLLSNLTATAQTRSVLFDTGTATTADIVSQVTTSGTGLQAGGAANGGTITGVEIVGTELYAVSNNGGLYRVSSGSINALGSNNNVGQYVGTATELVGLNFTGLRAGPSSLEDGRYSDLLFATTANGRIYAFNTAGELQNVFAGGQSSIATGVFNAQGLDFATLDYNLWHVTDDRESDAGHGINEAFHNARNEETANNSLVFNYDTNVFSGNYAAGESPVRNLNTTAENVRQDGQDVQGTYNLPGGARGVVESNAFSLAGYSASDVPVMYFNYFLDTDQFDNDNDLADGDADLFDEDRDSFRVYIVDSSGVEHLVATNNESRGIGTSDDEFDDPAEFGIYDDSIDVDVQQLYDNTGTWRQARVPLAAFAGQDGLALRFEFATAGTTSTLSAEIRTVAASELNDGDQFEIGDETFTVDFAAAIVFPSGQTLAQLYTNPVALSTFQLNDQVYVLNDGTRIVPADAISITLPADLTSLTAANIASLVQAELLTQTPAVPVVSNFNFSDPSDLVDPFGNANTTGSQARNDLTFEATPLPYTGGNLVIEGRGALGYTDLGIITDADDVDLVSLSVEAGSQIVVNSNADQIGVNNIVRFFDADGDEVDAANVTSDVLTGVFTLSAPASGLYYIGVSGPGNETYDPRIEGSTQDSLVGGYALSISIETEFNATASGALVEITGVTDITTPTNSGLAIRDNAVLTDNPISISRTATAAEVAAAVQQAVADTFYDGDLSLVPRSGSSLRLPGLVDSFTDLGSFQLTVDENGSSLDGRYGDRFGGDYQGGATDNAFEGAYIDDVVIGFAERGELVTASDAVGANDAFVDFNDTQLTSPSESRRLTDSGSYQLEIRDASEYIASGLVLDSDLGDDVSTEARFRAFDTNERLSDSGVALETQEAAQILDGSTFTISGSNQQVTFEFNVLDGNGNSNGITTGANRIEVRVSPDATAEEVADQVIAAVNANNLQSILGVTASRANLTRINTTTDVPDNNVILIGADTIGTTGNPFIVAANSDLRGDTNRDREEQGVIIIENSRFISNAEAGASINRAAETEVVPGTATPTILPSIRNFEQLNVENLLPGVVVRNSTFAFNGEVGIDIAGLENGGAATANPVGFDRIINNTLVGGTITTSDSLGSQAFNSILFPSGSISFADSVLTSGTELGDDVENTFADTETALGSPDFNGVASSDPTDGLFTLSLGSNGYATFVFEDNYLTGSSSNPTTLTGIGDGEADLIIFESGIAERVKVEISRDNETYFNVGEIFGLSNTIDLDAFGFGLNDRFTYVRLTDISGEDSFDFGAAGADIDAIGALSTVVREVYTPGQIGIRVQDNSAPTLLNNIVSNFDTGISIPDVPAVGSGQTDISSALTVIGGTLFHANTNASLLDGATGVGENPDFVDVATQIFVDASNQIFTPQSGSPSIDSGLSALEDRASLIVLKNSIGIAESPVLATRTDANGQTRVDDPTFGSESGTGVNAFVDRGAEERTDDEGPRFVLTSPRGEDLIFDGSNGAFGRSISSGTIYDSFEIQLIDGIRPADSGPGVGINDNTVLSENIIVTRLLDEDSEPDILQEGRDYRFSYEPADNTIRITPIAGIWTDNSIYTIQFLGGEVDNADGFTAAIQAQSGTNYSDGDQTVVDESVLEAELGIQLSVPPSALTDSNGITISNQTVTVNDGVNASVTFEFITDTDELDQTDPTLSESGFFAVTLPETASSVTIARLLAREINRVADDLGLLDLEAVFLDETDEGQAGRLQLLGNDNDAFVALEDESIFRQVNLALDVELLAEVTVDANGLSETNFDGQQIVVFDGTQEITFEFDTDNALTVLDPTITQVAVTVADGASTRELVAALITEIQAAGMDVTAFGASGSFRIRGNDGPISVTSPTDGALITGNSRIGVSPGFGLEIPSENGVLSPAIEDGQTFTLGLGVANPVTFEIDLNGSLLDPTATAVSVTDGSFDTTPNDLADAIVVAINSEFPGLAANAGGGRVTLGDDSDLQLNLSQTGLSQIVTPGESAAQAVVIRYDDDANTVAASFAAAAELAGIDAELVGDRVLLKTESTPRGDTVVTNFIADNAGNRLQPASEADGSSVEILIGELPSNRDPADVNDSGAVTPLDALLVINVLNQTGGSLDLSNVPAGVILPPYPDVNGDGTVAPLDALLVINRLNSLTGPGQDPVGAGEPLASSGEPLAAASTSTLVASGEPITYSSVADGVMATNSTIMFDPTKPASQSDETIVDTAPVTVTESKTSVFDSPAAIGLESIVDSLAQDRQDSESEGSGQSDGTHSAIDEIFASLG
ncbi:pre-peptidase C-terminal domain-containing protein [Neorhodopirellula lusitana]|uniref:Pre-peptidase C-terminal domain-containing protein n=1 Tax=Neorhodopirellula lusitana TaxID=445327 RepID=A0ABY1PZQ3_9BACT|nr:dockerin type I domain-containing protein [Neorhodopirellula lusitana]SMP52868.1 pre-peptidase C-terminal domain-containing protein [Neorhodopirellula lusitana]